MDNPRDISSSRIEEILKVHNVFLGLLSEYPRPSKPIKPFVALKVIEAWSCDLCYSYNPFFGTSTSRRDNHFRTKHAQNFQNREDHQSLVYTQTFCNGWSNNSYHFEVDETLVVDVASDAPYITRSATAEELCQIMKNRFTVASAPLSTGQTLKDTQPALYWTGWAAHVSDRNPEFLRLLIEYPAAATNNCQPDLLREIADEAKKVFLSEQELLDGRSGILRKLLVDTGKGTVVESYGQLLSRWVCFVLRLFQRQNAGDSDYVVTFTDRQKDVCTYALQWCHKHAKARKLGIRYIILRMARSFWAPEPLQESFAHLEKDQLDDPTTRFGCLLNLRLDGTFVSPSNMLHNLTMIKYIIRQMLLAWSVDRAIERSNSGDPVTAHFVLSSLGNALADDQLTPFAHICLATAHASRYARTTSFLPNVMWTSRTALSIDGSAVDFHDYQKMLKDRLDRLEELVHGSGGLLMDIPLADIGFTTTEQTHIHDEFSETRSGYSFLTDPKNPFSAMQFNLIDAIFKYRPGRLARGLHKSNDEKASITWDEKSVAEWLNIYDECTLELCTLIHAVGGQPACGVESCLLKLVNTPYRVRGVYAWRPGTLVFVLLYSKTTSMTGLDRVVAHAVPWRVGRLFLIINALARPLAGILVERSRGPLARIVQETSAFPIRGVEMTSTQLSDRLRTWFTQGLGVSLGIRAFRHFVIACQRKLMPEAFAPIQEAMAVVDTQSGHTSDTGNDVYAIDASEIHLLSPTSVIKSVYCSLRWAQILFPAGVLSNTETSEAVAADEVISSHSSTMRPSSISKSDITQAVLEALQDKALISQLSQHIGQHMVDTILATGKSIRVYNNSPPAARLVEPKHLVLLKRYQGDSNASWRSVSQGQALVHALARERSLLVILPTGGGKSVLFGCLPLIESGFTLVLFPFVALYKDQLHAAEERHNNLLRSDRQLGRSLRMVEWEPRLLLNENVGLVAVTVDTFVRPECQIWIDQNRRNLNRIVFDEVHVAVTQADFRPCMILLQALTRQGVPILGLSATIPPSMEDNLHESLGRPLFTVLVTQLRQRLELHSSDSYMSNNKEVKDWARTFGAYGYCSALNQDFNEEATRNLLDWTSGRSQILVGTTAVGTGLNHKAVRGVFHWGPPYGPDDFQQGSGRGGRDDLPAVSITVHWDPRLPSIGNNYRGKPIIDYMLDEEECIQLTMSRWFDGENIAVSCSGGINFRDCFRCRSAHLRATHRDGIALAGPEEPPSTNQVRDPNLLILHEIPRDVCTNSIHPPRRNATLIGPSTSHEEASTSIQLKATSKQPETTQSITMILPPLLEPAAPIVIQPGKLQKHVNTQHPLSLEQHHFALMH
ncbi:Helicase conserved C-terminal domain [Rhizoctonia solani]|uniref:DNA 3'-5' helicase n=1 Tax=Rhizoctonia solani TaxID=456999 RepID=A0A8H8SZM1_9AGAM|nr:Helicase conserved C-terminal domain [Rhizoctonia solani]QRW23744.1 Helicase conserved C-terminal domain [Rhizoctonia solani]